MSRRSGFTLIEVILAMVVSVVALTVIAQGMAAANRGTASAERRSAAAMLAARRIAEIESGELSLTFGGETMLCREDERYAWSVETVPHATELRQVTVRIYWAADGRQLAAVARLFKERL